jgi:predicted methyltransferase
MTITSFRTGSFRSILVALALGPAAACGGAESSADEAGATSTEATAGSEAAPASTTASEGAPGDLSAAEAIDRALAGDHRSAENKARDPYRHPKETLLFFGLEPDMTVVELAPGGGWYTEVLAPVLKDEGQLVAAIPSTEGPGAKYANRFLERMAEDPEVFGEVETVTLQLPEQDELGPPSSADMVLTFRSTHGWIQRGGAEAVYQAAYEVLKPGGIFGVVQHRAPEGADPKESAKDGYVPEAYVIELAESAGFELVDRSDVNANPADDHDHPEGVWTLPPTLRLGEKNKDEYLEIGESDRMTLKFQKPVAQ